MRLVSFLASRACALPLEAFRGLIAVPGPLPSALARTTSFQVVGETEEVTEREARARARAHRSAWQLTRARLVPLTRCTPLHASPASALHTGHATAWRTFVCVVAFIGSSKRVPVFAREGGERRRAVCAGEHGCERGPLSQRLEAYVASWLCATHFGHTTRANVSLVTTRHPIGQRGTRALRFHTVSAISRRPHSLHFHSAKLVIGSTLAPVSASTRGARHPSTRRSGA